MVLLNDAVERLGGWVKTLWCGLILHGRHGLG